VFEESSLRYLLLKEIHKQQSQKKWNKIWILFMRKLMRSYKNFELVNILKKNYQILRKRYNSLIMFNWRMLLSNDINQNILLFIYLFNLMHF